MIVYHSLPSSFHRWVHGKEVCFVQCCITSACNYLKKMIFYEFYQMNEWSNKKDQWLPVWLWGRKRDEQVKHKVFLRHRNYLYHTVMVIRWQYAFNKTHRMYNTQWILIKTTDFNWQWCIYIATQWQQMYCINARFVNNRRNWWEKYLGILYFWLTFL